MFPVRRVIRLYKVFTLFNALLWWLPIFYRYQRDVGLSDGEIFGIQSIYYAMFLALDIPTSILADRFDYRRFLVAGAAILAVANLTPVVWPSYGGFLTHFLLIALAYSLTSGAGSAYLYEYLHRSGAGEAYRQAEGGARAYSLVGRDRVFSGRRSVDAVVPAHTVPAVRGQRCDRDGAGAAAAPAAGPGVAPRAVLRAEVGSSRAIAEAAAAFTDACPADGAGGGDLHAGQGHAG